MANIFEGALAGIQMAEERKQARHKQIADNAIRQAQFMHQQRQETQQQANSDRDFNLNVRKAESTIANTNTDNERLAELGKSLIQRRQDATNLGYGHLAAALQRETNVMDRFQKEQNWAKKKAVNDSAMALVKQGVPQQTALARSYEQVDTIDRLHLGKSILPPPSLLPGAAFSPPLNMSHEGQTTQDGLNAIAKTSLPTDTATPTVEAGLARSEAQTSKIKTDEQWVKERTRQIKDSYNDVKLSRKIINDLNILRQGEVKARTNLTELMTTYTPQQLTQKLATGQANLGLIQSRTQQILQKIADDRAESGKSTKERLSTIRNSINSANTNYRMTLKAWDEQTGLYETLPKIIANAERGVFPADPNAPTDPEKLKVYQSGQISIWHGMLNQATILKNRYTDLLEKQKADLEQLEKERTRATFDKNVSDNVKPEIPKAGYSIAQGRSGQKMGVYKPGEVRKLGNGMTIPVNPPTPPNGGQKNFSAPATTPKQKAVKDMNKAELEVFIREREKQKR